MCIRDSLSMVERWLSATIGEGLIYDLRSALFDHVQRQPIAFFTRTQTGALVSRMNNDVIGAQRAVTGTLGAAAAGSALLQLPVDDPRRLATTAPLLIAAHTRPEPRVRAGGLALEHGAHAAMDLSDGLFGDLPKILSASGVNAEIDLSALPVAASIRALFPDRWLELATRGGEDYELLLTIPPDRFERLQAALRDNE